MAEFLLVPNVTRLRHKLLNARGDLKILWDHLLHVAEMDDPRHAAYAVFACLVTGDHRYQKKARAFLVEEIVNPPPDGWHSPAFLNEHMWIHCAMCVKFCIYYDWLMNLGLLTDDEARTIGEKTLSSVYDYFYRWLKHVADEPRTFLLPNNQVSAVLRAFLYVGHLFGGKYGRNERVGKLAHIARDAYRGVIGQVHPGGYNGEGALYSFNICCSALVLYTALLEQLTGRDLFFQNFPTGSVSLKDIIDGSLKLLSVSGLAIPIDSYDYNAGFGALTPVVYAAAKTADPSYLELLKKDMYYPPLALEWALGQFGDPRIPPALTEKLHHSPLDRRGATRALEERFLRQ